MHFTGTGRCSFLASTQSVRLCTPTRPQGSRMFITVDGLLVAPTYMLQRLEAPSAWHLSVGWSC